MSNKLNLPTTKEIMAADLSNDLLLCDIKEANRRRSSIQSPTYNAQGWMKIAEPQTKRFDSKITLYIVIQERKAKENA